MSNFIIQQGLLGLVRLLTTAVAAGWIGAPMSWSPDGRWLCYTTAPDPTPSGRHPGWIFEAPLGQSVNRDDRGHAEARADGAPEPQVASGPFRIWASPRDGGPSALIEESDWPLTAACWSPRGHSLAFGRFVPDSMDARGATVRGRLDVVIQDSLDRKRTVLAVPAFVLDDEVRARFADVGPVWSPDGQFLAFSRPGGLPAILVIRLESRRVVQTLDGALLPSWSPDGAKLAFLHQDDPGAWSLHVADRQGQAFGSRRALLPVGRVPAPLGWGGDGRSILAVVEGMRQRVGDLDLVRISPESRDATRIFSLVPEAQRRMAMVRGIAIDFDRNEDLCFFSSDLEGRDTDVCWSIPRDQRPYRRFSPLDPSLRIGSLAIAPDGRAVAMRFGRPGALSPPAVCELDTEHVPPTERNATLIVPDEAGRRAWIDLLARTARSLLSIAMTPVVVDDRPVRRPTVLPMPDEIPAAPHVRSRFARLGRYGSSLCTIRRRAETTPARSEPDPAPDLEDRLFFDYLRGDYTAAMADLEALESRTVALERRLALLSLRSQILWAQGDLDGAREVAGFLVDAVGGPVYRVEDTPLGRSLVPEPGSGRAWARYLAQRTRQPQAPTSDPNPGDRDDPLLNNPPAPIRPPGFDLPPGRGIDDGLPFAPNLQDPQAEAMIRAELRRLQRQLQLDAPRRQVQPPPPPRPIEGRPR